MDLDGTTYTVFKVGDRANGGAWDISETLPVDIRAHWLTWFRVDNRSEEHTSELQSHSFISYAVFCLKKKRTQY